MSKNNNQSTSIIIESFVRKGNINDKPMTPRPSNPPQGMSPTQNPGPSSANQRHTVQNPSSTSEK